MKKIPIALGVIIGGLMCVILGAANGWAAIIVIGGIAIIGGWAWFAKGWRELMNWMLPVRFYTNRIRRIEKEAKLNKAEQAAIDSAVNRKLNRLCTRQTINGFVRTKDNSKVVEFTNKEETA